MSLFTSHFIVPQHCKQLKQ